MTDLSNPVEKSPKKYVHSISSDAGRQLSKTNPTQLSLTGRYAGAYYRIVESSKDQTVAPGLSGALKALLVSARPKQWTKNLIVFFALFFTVGEAWSLDPPDVALSFIGRAAAAFVIFSALSSAVYLINDVLDVDKDREHPRKKFRPIASGALSTSMAWVSAAVLAIASLGLAFVVEPLFALVALAYLALMLAYSVALKSFILLDVFSIAGGFVLRAVAGAAVLQVPVSPWLYTCTGLGALLIALSKRRSELAIAGDGAGKQRETLETYTTPLLDQFIAIVAPSTLLAYTLYTFTAPNLPDNSAMMLTIPFVAYGLFRYIYLVHARDLGESPEDVLITDVPLIVSMVLWLATAATVLIAFRA